jgi:hypothetical protein
MEVYKMANSKLMKAFYDALSMGSVIPQGHDRAHMEKLTRDFAALRKIEFTEEELQEVLDYAMNIVAKDNVRLEELPELRIMK